MFSGLGANGRRVDGFMGADGGRGGSTTIVIPFCCGFVGMILSSVGLLTV